MARGTVLVTGTSTGIGRATALHLATLGFDVLAGVRSESDGARLRELAPARIRPVELDVTDQAQVAAAVEAAGSSGLDGLVNNAGVTAQGPIEHLEIDELRRVLEINLVGVAALTKAALPLLRTSRGTIVMVSSIGGRRALPFVSPYNASKFGLEGFSDSLRMEVEPLGVHVAIVEPGSVKTEIWRKGLETSRAFLASMPADGRAVYGKRLEGMLETAQKTAARGVEPIQVAETIADALTSSRPKPRYVVGADARVQAGLTALLPTRAADSLLRRLSKT